MSEIRRHLSTEELHAGLDAIRQSPAREGRVEMIACRPETGTRKVLDEARLDTELGLVGDNWKSRGNRKTQDGAAHPEMQINIMNARAIALIAQERARWPLAGDQLYVDLDLSGTNLPPGTRLAVGSAVLEVTAMPHDGCAKFVERFGHDAMRFVNSEIGQELHLRGINARVVSAGTVRAGDPVTKLER